MQSERNNIGWRFWGTWVLATTIGWPIGIITAFIVAHIVNIVYPKETNLVVGLCLGAVVGYAQRRFARNPMTASGRWVLSTSIGMGIPYVAVVIADEFRSGLPGLISGVQADMAQIAAVGGLITGLLQLRSVRRQYRKAGLWILASIVGWGLGWLAMDLVSTVGLYMGGAILGVVTGGAIVWLHKNPPSADRAGGEARSTADMTSSN